MIVFASPTRTARRTGRWLRAAAAFASLAALTACGAVGNVGSLTRDVLGIQGPPSVFNASRAQLAAAGITEPLIRVVLREPRVQSAGYRRIGASNGVTFYRANDGSEVLLAGGLLRAATGFQQDLNGADTATIRRALAAGSGGYIRTLRHRSGEGQLFETTVACTLSSAGRETIVILGRSHDTTVFRESCTARSIDPIGRRPAFENTYWLEGGTVRASEQWVSFATGMMRIEQVLP